MECQYITHTAQTFKGRPKDILRTSLHPEDILGRSQNVHRISCAVWVRNVGDSYILYLKVIITNDLTTRLEGRQNKLETLIFIIPNDRTTRQRLSRRCSLSLYIIVCLSLSLLRLFV